MTSHTQPNAILSLTNRMWFSVVCTLIDSDRHHHSDQNVVDSATNFDHCDDVSVDFTIFVSFFLRTV